MTYSNGPSFGNSSGDSLGSDVPLRTQPGIEHYAFGAGPDWAMRGLGNPA